MVDHITRYSLKDLKLYSKDARCPKCWILRITDTNVKILDTYVCVGEFTTVQTKVLCKDHGEQYWSCVI